MRSPSSGAENAIQEQLTGGALQFTPASHATVVAWLVESLLRRRTLEPHAILANLQASRPGQEVQVNPHFFSHQPRVMPVEERAQILEQVLQGFAPLPGFVPE